MTKTLQAAVKPVKLTTPNGITLILKENHSTPIVSLCVYFPGGVRSETPAVNGITALAQNVLQKGTTRRSAETIANELESIGARMHTVTGKDLFGATLSVLSKHLPQALEIFADCVLNPAFAAGEVDRERTNTLLELEKKKDEPYSYCFELCERALYGDHPYGLPVLGRPSSVQALTPDDLAEWHRRHFSARRMVAALVGDVAVADAQRALSEKFMALPPTADGVAPLAPPEPLAGIHTEREERDKRQVVLALGFAAPPVSHHDYAAVDVMTHIFAGMGARFFIELRDKLGLAYTVSAVYEARLAAGSLRCYIGTSPEKAEQAEAAMLGELEKAKDKRVSNEELHRAKQYMLGLYEIGLQRNASQASQYAYWEEMGLGYQMVEQYPSLIKKITASDVKAVAQKYLDTTNYAKAILAPPGANVLSNH